MECTSSCGWPAAAGPEVRQRRGSSRQQVDALKSRCGVQGRAGSAGLGALLDISSSDDEHT